MTWQELLNEGEKRLSKNGLPKAKLNAFYFFLDCFIFTVFTIPDIVMLIGDFAFSVCTSLTEITIPDSVTEIGDGAFYDCTNLTAITIPDSVTSIGENAFGLCTNLTIYGYTGSYAETYAKENDIPFVSLGNITTTETTTTTIETTVTTTTETGTTKTTSTTKATTTTEIDTTKTTAATKTTTTTTTEATTTTKKDSETPTVIYGDITLDGRVDITDAVLLHKFCSGAVILNDAAKLNSDCDGDGDITGNDAVALLQFLVQIVQKLPYTA